MQHREHRQSHKTLAEEFIIAANTGAKILSVELRIAITAAETLARNAVDFLTANNTTTDTIIRCIEVEFQKLDSSIYDIRSTAVEFPKAIRGIDNSQGYFSRVS